MPKPNAKKSLKGKQSQPVPNEVNIKIPKEKLLKYSRGNPLSKKILRRNEDKKSKGILLKQEERIKSAVEDAARVELALLPEASGYLQPESALERTYKVKQDDIASFASTSAISKSFEINLEESFGPYRIQYSRQGKYLMMASQEGATVGAFDWKTGSLLFDVKLPKEKIYDIQWLHNETLFAVAQYKHAYIYDKNGVEVHSLGKHRDARHLEFLPYHMLLVSSGLSGTLLYQDISTGVVVNEIKTKLGSTLAMAQNPTNAIIHLGHSNGTVTLWSPNCGSPLVKMLCHRGALSSISIVPSSTHAGSSMGAYMATAGLDGQIKIWDLRTYKLLDSYYSKAAPTCVSFSQRGLLAVTSGATVTVWKDVLTKKQKDPYMTHTIPRTTLTNCQFCPFEDVLGIGHSKGFSSLIIPGAGEANFDSYEVNPFETIKQRREAEVRQLLHKLSPDMIALDTDFIGKIKDDHSVVLEWNRQLDRQANQSKAPNEQDEFLGGKAKAQSSTLRRYLKRGANVLDPRRQAKIEEIERKKEQRRQAQANLPPKKWSPLDRFLPKDN